MGGGFWKRRILLEPTMASVAHRAKVEERYQGIGYFQHRRSVEIRVGDLATFQRLSGYGVSWYVIRAEIVLLILDALKALAA